MGIGFSLVAAKPNEAVVSAGSSDPAAAQPEGQSAAQQADELLGPAGSAGHQEASATPTGADAHALKVAAQAQSADASAAHHDAPVVSGTGVLALPLVQPLPASAAGLEVGCRDLTACSPDGFCRGFCQRIHPMAPARRCAPVLQVRSMQRPHLQPLTSLQQRRRTQTRLLYRCALLLLFTC